MTLAADPIAMHLKVILFVAGNEPNSVAARANLRRLCDTVPGCEIDCEVVDVLLQHPVALERRILVTPCLVLIDPLPEVMIVGSLTDLDRVRLALRLPMGASSDG